MFKSLCRPASKIAVCTTAAAGLTMRGVSTYAVEFSKPGNGVKPKAGDQVTVHYTGKLLNGQVFDSSVQRGQPFSFRIGVGQVIKGWDMGVMEMDIGSKAVITCAPSHAYGERGFPPVIPRNATLLFEVELLAINNKTE